MRRSVLVVFASGCLASVAWNQTTPCPAWSVFGDQGGARLGPVASAGDVNGDGFDDVIVGAPFFDDGELDEGRALVYLGSSGGLSTAAVWSAESDQADAHFGASVAGVGDVNGDGFDDVIVGAPDFHGGLQHEGRASVFLGSPTGPATTAAWTAESDQGNALFGTSVAGAGDVNGDGFDDVIVGAPLFDGGQANEGRAYVFLGSAAGLATTPAWTAESDHAAGFSIELGMGAAVAGAGDVNDDGFDDVIVGCPLVARAFVFYGSASGPSLAPDAELENNDSFGDSVAGAGDVNGDGIDDVIVGASVCCEVAFDENSEGAAYVFLGNPVGITLSPFAEVHGPSVIGPDSLLGTAVGAAGDVNADGFGDVVVAVPGNGKANAYLGSPTDIALHFTAGGGKGVAGAGDVDGDGFDDVVVGRTWTGPPVDEGRADLYRGSPVGLVRSATFRGDGVNADTVAAMDMELGSTWSAPLTVRHPHGAGGALTLLVRTHTINGPSVTSPLGGRVTELLVAGQLLGSFAGTHNGSTGNIPAQAIPNQVALLGLSWAAQYVVLGGGFADLSQAVFGRVTSCP